MFMLLDALKRSLKGGCTGLALWSRLISVQLSSCLPGRCEGCQRNWLWPQQGPSPSAVWVCHWKGQSIEQGRKRGLRGDPCSEICCSGTAGCQHPSLGA